MSGGWLQETAEGVTLRIHAQPGAKKSAVVGLHGDSLKIRIAAPPVEGKANVELIRFLARLLGKRKSEVRLVGGESSREKTVTVSGIRVEDASRKLEHQHAEQDER